MQITKMRTQGGGEGNVRWGRGRRGERKWKIGKYYVAIDEFERVVLPNFQYVACCLFHFLSLALPPSLPQIGKYYVAIDEFERVVLPHLMPSDTTRLHIVDEVRWQGWVHGSTISHLMPSDTTCLHIVDEVRWQGWVHGSTISHLMPSDTTRLHIVDEIGRMELCSDKFRDAVLSLLSSALSPSPSASLSLFPLPTFPSSLPIQIGRMELCSDKFRDAIGRMELCSDKFRDAVLNLLASPVAVFGALPAPRYGHTLELVEEIKQRADTGQQGRHSSADRRASHSPLSRKGRSSNGGSDHALMPHAIPPYPPLSPSLIPPLSAVLTLIKANRDATAVQIEELLTRLIQEGEKGAGGEPLCPHASCPPSISFLFPLPYLPPFSRSHAHRGQPGRHSTVLTLTKANRDATAVQIEELLTRLIQEGEKGAGGGALGEEGEGDGGVGGVGGLGGDGGGNEGEGESNIGVGGGGLGYGGVRGAGTGAANAVPAAAAGLETGAAGPALISGGSGAGMNHVLAACKPMWPMRTSLMGLILFMGRKKCFPTIQGR
ncbi:unnamed protein product [Closterium sp. NIES-64]|nr:unnamed protein product [Closterium sp. NIES-64]